MSSPPVVLFDLDGTLTDTNYLHTLAWRRAFRDNGHQVSCWRIHRLIGASGAKLMTDCIGRVDDDVKAAWRAWFDQFVGEIHPFPGARELIESVRARGAEPALATSSPKDLVAHHLAALGYGEEDFAVITTDADVDHAKPAPDVFQVALAAVNGTPDRAIVIGDTGWDIDAARAAGLASIAVCSGGWTRDDLIGRGAIEVHDDVAALGAALDTSVLGDLLDASGPGPG